MNQFLREVWVNERGLRLLRPRTPRRHGCGGRLNRQPLGYEDTPRRDKRRPSLPTSSDIYNADQARWATLGSVDSNSWTEGGQPQEASQALPNLGTHI